MLKVSGTCLISKDKTTNHYKLEFAKTSNGNDLVKGSLYWQDSGTNKEGNKTSSDIRFVAYKNMVNFIRDNCNQVLELKDCPLKKYSWKDKNGVWQNMYEVIIFDASVYQKKEASTQSFYEPKESKEDEDFPIPF